MTRRRVATIKDRSPRWARTAVDVTTRRYALVGAGSRPGPDFLVVGTKRGGTTSLFNYLCSHPGVLGMFPRPREKKSTDYFFTEYQRGPRWYRSHFHTEQLRALMARRLGYRPLGGEASPYYIWDPRIAERVATTAPGVRAIMLVRDPVERAWSHYRERVHNGVEPLSFDDALDAEEDRTSGELDRMMADPGYHSTAYDWYSYRARGVYLPQIQNWLQHFPASQLLVLRSEDLYDDVPGTVDRVAAFLDLPTAPLPTTRAYNAVDGRSGMSDSARAALSDFYAEPNGALTEFLGRDLGWS